MSEQITSKETDRVRGVVKSDKMDKTITVVVERLMKHPKYGKYISRHSTYVAHDAHNEAHEGDMVDIERTRPLSRRKRWRLVRIVRRAPSTAIELAEG
jgi:small subunit ribosomal protein S17